MEINQVQFFLLHCIQPDGWTYIFVKTSFFEFRAPQNVYFYKILKDLFDCFSILQYLQYSPCEKVKQKFTLNMFIMLFVIRTTIIERDAVKTML